MIQYALVCKSKHRFDAWFKSAQAYEEQSDRGILTCPVCNSSQVEKALMAPALARAKTGAGTDRVALTANQPERGKMLAAMRAIRDKMTSEADYVGPRFAEEARKMHFSEAAPRGIYGEATRDEVAALVEDGIEFMPLPHLADDHN